MTTLYILRHGIAVERGAPGFRGEKDADRPLTPEGAKKVRRIAKALRQLDVQFDLLLTSPFARALRTAEIVAQMFRAKKKLEVCADLAVGGDPAAVVGRLRRLGRGGNPPGEIMLVGHEPYLSELISVLLAGRTGLPLTLKKGGLCKLSITEPRYGLCATLEWLVAPQVLIGR
jgi:phosphohistidine phosphatase